MTGEEILRREEILEKDCVELIGKKGVIGAGLLMSIMKEIRSAEMMRMTLIN